MLILVVCLVIRNECLALETMYESRARKLESNHNEINLNMHFSYALNSNCAFGVRHADDIHVVC